MSGQHEAAVHSAEAHGTFRSYLVGFALSVVLTAIPFWLVMAGVIHDKNIAILSVTALAAVQMVIHMIYFLHLTPRAESGWSLSSLIFTGILVIIVLIGSLWVMYHMNANMLPGANQQMSEMG